MHIKLLLLLSFYSLTGSAQNFIPVDEGSKVHFSIRNFGVNTGGDLSGLKGAIHFDPANIEASAFVVSAAVKTIDTDSEKRDEHLREESYFDAEKYPEILIKSTGISKGTSGGLRFTGTLTIRDITKAISFPFEAVARGNDLLFSGEFEINRLDFSVGEASAVLSKTVKISLIVLAKKS